MTPTPQHQEQAEVMAKAYLRNVQGDVTDEASLNSLFAHIPLPKLLADQAECGRLKEKLDRAYSEIKCSSDPTREEQRLEIAKLRAERDELRNTLKTLSDSSVTAHAFLELKGQYETLLKYHEHFNMDLHDEGIKGDQARTLVATQEVELKRLRTQNTALLAVARAANKVIKDSGPMLPPAIGDMCYLQQALTAATQAGVELEGV